MFDKDKIFWTSDLHFYHKNIIGFSHRPFKDLSHMHESLINNWNKVVTNDDTVIINGDFAFTSNISDIETLLNRLNGAKILIYGNHCIQNKFEREAIKKLFNYNTYHQFECYIKDEDTLNGLQSVFNSHYPCLSWPSKARNGWHTFGHVHTSPNAQHSRDYEDMLVYNTLKLKSYDVGVDNNNFTPVSYKQLKDRFDKL